jgi:hypothetical protein
MELTEGEKRRRKDEDMNLSDTNMLINRNLLREAEQQG